MRAGWKTVLALGFVGAVAVAGTAVSQSADPTPVPSERPKLGERDGLRDRLGDRRAKHRRDHRGRGRRVVHSELKVQLRDGGFGTVVFDHGTVTGVDAGNNTITIERTDGETLTFTATDDTAIGKDGRRVELSAIETGDRARVVQRDDGDGLKVARIMAHTPPAEEDAAAATGPPATDTGLA